MWSDSFLGFFLVNCKALELFPSSWVKNGFLLEPAIACTSCSCACMLSRLVLSITAWFTCWIRFVTGFLLCNLDYGLPVSHLNRELGKKKQKPSFLPHQESAGSEQVLESPFKHLMKFMILFELTRTELVIGVQHPQSIVIFKTSGLALMFCALSYEMWETGCSPARWHVSWAMTPWITEIGTRNLSFGDDAPPLICTANTQRPTCWAAICSR